MSLARRRIDNSLNRILEEQIKLGRIPGTEDVALEMNKLFSNDSPQIPAFKLFTQKFKQKFDVNAYNDGINQIHDDLMNIYDELVSQGVSVLRSLNKHDAAYMSLRGILQSINDEMDSILEDRDDANPFFFTIFESFNSLTNIDRTVTDAEIDLGEGVVRIPKDSGNTTKINTSHLSSRSNIIFKVTNIDPGDIARNSAIDGNGFGNAWNDQVTAWQQMVATEFPGGVSAEFIVPVTPKRNPDGTKKTDDQMEIEMSRITVDPMTPTEMDVDIQYSLDGVNYLKFSGNMDFKTVSDKPVSWIFERVKVQFLKFVLIKNSPDGETDIRLRDGTLSMSQIPYYIFGFRNISLFDIGYGQEAVMQSKALTPSGDLASINRIRLDVDQDIPPGTNIKYSIATGNDPSKFLPIGTETAAPSNDPEFIDLNMFLLSERNENPIDVASTPPAHAPAVNGITFYKIKTGLPQVEFRTAKLFRGKNSWDLIRSQSEETKDVKSNYIKFTLTDNKQKLYIEVEREEISHHTASKSSSDTIVVVSNTILKDESFNLTPSGGDAIEQPDYSIKQVIRVIGNSNPISGSDGEVEGIGGNVAIFKSPTLTSSIGITAGMNIHINALGVDSSYSILRTRIESGIYVLEIDDPNNVFAASKASSATWRLPEEDITGSVNDISGNTFSIDSSKIIGEDDVIAVTYRRTLKSSERLSASSVVVTDDTGTIFEQGVDYIVDVDDASISRITTGKIKEGSVSVDFTYVTKIESMYVYSTYVRVASEDPVEIHYSALSFSDTKESFVISTNRGIFELKDQTKTPRLNSGYHKVTVVSRPVTHPDGSLDTSSAIYKVINMKDIDGKFVFSKNLYFDQQWAKLEPMKQTSLFRLKYAIRKEENGFFAIDNGDLVINFDPTLNKNKIYLLPGDNSLQNREQFELEYKTLTGAKTPVTSLIFKAILQRTDEADDSVTPALREYRIRILS